VVIRALPTEPRVWFLGSGPTAFDRRWKERLLRHTGGILPVWRGGTRLDAHVEAALTADAEFCDPKYDIAGHAAIIAMIEAFQAENDDVVLRRTSAIDAHHDRARYHWDIVWGDGRRFEGLDAVTLDLDQMRIKRIDGFFGPLQAETPPA